MARGLVANTSGTALYTVIENTAYRVLPDGDREEIGTLLTRRGTVGMRIGLNQLVIVDGPYGYVYDLAAGTFTQITSDGWLGSETVEYFSGYFVFIDPATQTFYKSALEDALTIDPLDFATANAAPDKLIGMAVTGKALLLLGEAVGEVWQDAGLADFTFQANTGALIQAGLLGAHTVKGLDNSIFWLGRDVGGAGIVYRLEGFQARRISTMAVEQAIQRAISDGEDMTKAVAYSYQQGGHSFYVLQVPGLDTTWCYDAASGQWHERAELVNGDYAQHRIRYHAYCYGKHLGAGDDDVIYEYDVDANDNAGDVLVRDRISPHYATPRMDRIQFGAFELDCTVGKGKGDEEAKVLLRYSNDGGLTWGNWREGTLGKLGERYARARFLRCGSARDRVWQVRCTDSVAFAIVNANIEAME
jgi:hypothetical protein